MHCRARLRNWFNTKNTHGSQFGGSLFALTDPIYPIMLGCLYGDKYYVWDKSAHIEFVQPAMGEVYLDCRLSHADRASIEAATANGEKHFPVLPCAFSMPATKPSPWLRVRCISG